MTATIALTEGGTLVSGAPETDPGHLDGRANTFAGILWHDVAPVLNRARAEWIVRQPAGSTVAITASAAKAGIARAEVSLG